MPTYLFTNSCEWTSLQESLFWIVRIKDPKHRTAEQTVSEKLNNLKQSVLFFSLFYGRKSTCTVSFCTGESILLFCVLGLGSWKSFHCQMWYLCYNAGLLNVKISIFLEATNCFKIQYKVISNALLGLFKALQQDQHFF